MRCQRHILGIHWSDYITNDTVLGRTGRRPFNDIIIQRRLEWLGHVIRMPADRLPRQSLSAEGNDMTDWSLQPGGQRITWRDIVDRDLKPFRRPGVQKSHPRWPDEQQPRRAPAPHPQSSRGIWGSGRQKTVESLHTGCDGTRWEAHAPVTTCGRHRIQLAKCQVMFEKWFRSPFVQDYNKFRDSSDSQQLTIELFEIAYFILIVGRDQSVPNWTMLYPDTDIS